MALRRRGAGRLLVSLDTGRDRNLLGQLSLNFVAQLAGEG